MTALALSELDLQAAQRARGEGRLRVKTIGARTAIDRLYQDGCAKIRLPRDAAARDLEAVLINTAGGLTGGDRLAWSVEASDDAALTLTTQACEKVYRAGAGRAEVAVQLTAGTGARIDWLPQETILFDAAALARGLRADLAADARLLALEAVVLGRTARGEVLRSGFLRERWRIRRAGRLIFADDVALGGDIDALAALSSTLNGGRAFATILLAAPEADQLVAPLRTALGEAGGASAFDGKLVCRIVVGDGLALRRVLLPALDVLRGGRPLPRIWGL